MEVVTIVVVVVLSILVLGYIVYRVRRQSGDGLKKRSGAYENPASLAGHLDMDPEVQQSQIELKGRIATWNKADGDERQAMFTYGRGSQEHTDAIRRSKDAERSAENYEVGEMRQIRHGAVNRVRNQVINRENDEDDRARLKYREDHRIQVAKMGLSRDEESQLKPMHDNVTRMGGEYQVAKLDVGRGHLNENSPEFDRIKGDFDSHRDAYHRTVASTVDDRMIKEREQRDYLSNRSIGQKAGDRIKNTGNTVRGWFNRG